MPDCIFCKIARGEVPSQKAHHEDDSIVSFLDLNPKAPGHTLVIPVEHHIWFQDMPDDISDKLFRASKKIAKKLKADYGADYVKLRINGQDIPHVHVHLIPHKL